MAEGGSPFEPIGLDNMQRSGIESLPWGPLEVADICDRPALDAVLRADPAGAYDRMTFATRDHYRHVVERVAIP